jgi:hypothetical protein
MNPRRTAKSIRTWENTMEAYGNASGWKREGNSAMWDSLGKQPDGSRVGVIKIDGHHPGVFTPGEGNVTAYYDNYAPSGRYRGKRPTTSSGTAGIKPGKLTEQDKNNGN